MTRQRSRYAECIIGLLEKALYKPVNVPVAIAMAERKRDIPRRIEMIMDRKRKITAKVSPKAIIAMLLIGFLALPIIGGIELVRFSGARPASNEGRIVFDRNGGIWVMDADGKNEQQLTAPLQRANGNNSQNDHQPTWSPDGRQIAFSRWTDDGNWSDIYIMNVDGSDIRRLTISPEDAGNPAWSPDGKHIAFDRSIYEKKDGQWQKKRLGIYVMDADGSNVRLLLEDKTEFPTWSPDGSKIAYYSCQPLPQSVWVMDANGENREKIYRWGQAPDWSPNGNKIVFVSDQDSWKNWKSNDIFVINSDGTNLQRLTKPGPQDHWSPRWSPDGAKIVFADKDEWDIYVMNADGSNIQAITNSPTKYDGYPDWTAYSYGVEPTGKLRTTWGKIKCALGSKANN
jgi:TolB protein